MTRPSFGAVADPDDMWPNDDRRQMPRFYQMPLQFMALLDKLQQSKPLGVGMMFDEGKDWLRTIMPGLWR